MRVDIEFDLMHTNELVQYASKELNLTQLQNGNNFVSNTFYIEVNNPFDWMLEVSEADFCFISGVQKGIYPIIFLEINEDFEIQNK